MKKIYVIFLLLTFTLLLLGCSTQINSKLSSNKNISSSNQTQQVINESSSNTKTSEIKNNTQNTSRKPTNAITTKSYTMKDIETYFKLKRFLVKRKFRRHGLPMKKT
jgi:uncharacterized protein YcfL